MTDRSIICTGPEVRALLAGTKTQHRVVLKPRAGATMADFHEARPHPSGVGAIWECAPDKLRVPFAVGDRLWVREKHWSVERLGQGIGVPHLIYDEEWCNGFPAESAPLRPCGLEFGAHPSVHMRRWASRLTLLVTGMRVQRLQEISEADAAAEGAPCGGFDDDGKFYEGCKNGTFRAGFAGIWAHRYGPDAVEENPWVAALTFTVAHRNIDKETDHG